MDDADEDTALLPVASSGTLQMVVDADGVHVAKVLPATGELTIGRASTCDVVVPHRSVSRLHARLRVSATGVEICDVGSANGTRVRNLAVTRNSWSPVRIGDAVQIGDAIALLRRGSPQPRRVWTHGYFEGRVEEEAARSTRGGLSFAVIRLNLTGGELPTAQLEEVFSQTLRVADVLAVYAPGEFEVLLVDTTAEESALVLERLRKRLEALGLRAASALACFPRDASVPATLLAIANAAVRGNRIHPVEGAVFGSSEPMRNLHATIDQVARGNISVLIQGETGVGKEVCAETVHKRSPRAAKTFLRLNCAALSESLLETELFGHERGAFTGAVTAKPGLIESADGGTVFLDEIGELTPAIQVKLLRVLDEKRVMRVGALQSKPVDVRFLSATNRDLEAEVTAGRFRQDLYFRLAGVTLSIPPLRERADEILPLARAFVARAAADGEMAPPPEISVPARALLERYSWPGNVRELRNVMERAVLICNGGPILARHLPVEKMEATLRQSSAPAPVHVAGLAVAGGPSEVVASERDDPASELQEAAAVTLTGIPALPPAGAASAAGRGGLREDLAALEKQRILDALRECGGNQSAAARLLRMPRATLIARIEQFGVVRPRKRR